LISVAKHLMEPKNYMLMPESSLRACRHAYRLYIGQFFILVAHSIRIVYNPNRTISVNPFLRQMHLAEYV
jgi:hypothetical protein